MVPFKQIAPAIWEIERTGDMRVPARIYANQKIALAMTSDRTMGQISNVATLPGIVSQAALMPDGHEGYGFPIGGVAAFDMDEGVISPGGVGYDINCLTGDARILTELGFNKPIADFEHDFSTDATASQGLLLKRFAAFELLSYNKELRKLEADKPVFFIRKIKPQNILEIKTESGFAIHCTAEHPIMTPDGMTDAGKLRKGDLVGLYPFVGIAYETPPEQVIVSYSDISASQECINELLKRGLLPLKENSEALPYLAKILGYLFGDGCVYFTKGKGYVHAYGSRGDLECMKSDLEKIGYSANIYERTRDHEITGQYGVKSFTSTNYELHATSTSLARLLVALGLPLGKKASTDYMLPVWVKTAKRWIKRLFLAGLFGAELSKPRTNTKTGFSCPVFAQNKTTAALNSGRMFMIELMGLLEQFGINVNKISQRREFRNKEGETHRLRLIISADEDNLLRLYGTVGFEYNQKRSDLASMAILYIRRKQALTLHRAQIAERVKELKSKGLKAQEIKQLFISPLCNERFIERCLYEKSSTRITLDFESFDNFVEKCAEQLRHYGLIFEPISSITQAQAKEIVYDFTIAKNHSFVANGIVVSNCGVRLVRTDWAVDDIKPKVKQLLDTLFNEVPSGVGRAGLTRLSDAEMKEILAKGSRWSLEQGFGTKDDLEATEDYGCIKGADPEFVSQTAIARGKPQLGTLGAGNHFLEIQKVDHIYDEKTAKAFGIDHTGQITVMIHCGSRGLGHQVASDYIREMEKKYGFEGLPDRELINAPINSELGQQYFKAMSAGANYAFANRQMIVHWVRDSFRKVMGTDQGMRQVYDVCHNIAKFEEHNVDGASRQLCVHRKGATRSFGPGREELNEIHQSTGQPVFIPGTMGTASYILVGTAEAEEKSWGSTAHGAGREMSRAEAIRRFRGETVARELESQGILVKAASMKGIAEESAPAYKDVDEVCRVSDKVKLGKLVARLVPLGVVKG